MVSLAPTDTAGEPVSTLTTTLNAVPLQVDEPLTPLTTTEGVTRYVTNVDVLFALDRVPEILEAFVPLFVPEIPETEGAFQVYCVVEGTTLPAIPFAGVTKNV